MVENVCKNAKEGSVILFHNDLENTPKALEQILKKFSQEGFEFVSASELIYKENYYLDSAGVQYPR